MKKKTINKITLFTALGLGVVLLASCTANFASTQDQANIYFTYDMGTTRYSNNPDAGYNQQTNENLKNKIVTSKETIYYWQDLNNDFLTDNNDGTKHVAKLFVDSDKESLTYACIASGIKVPDTRFWFALDQKVMSECLEKENKNINDCTAADVRDALYQHGGQVKFNGGYNTKDKNQSSFTKIESWTTQIKNECISGTAYGGLRVDQCPNTGFTSAYQTFLKQKVNNIRSCISITKDGLYGNYGWNHSKISMTQKTWGEAWGKGLISGLIVFPIAWLTETFSHSFGMNGWGQLASILLVTFIVRTFLLLVSLKSTIGQQKMQMLQPELNKIQAKYPNANTNAAQKQRLSQEQMALYKKNKINPLGTLVVLIVQFPLFIGVWGAMQGSASLATDQVMNLYLSESIWNTLLKFPQGWQGNTNGCWTAFTLIIIMSIAQFVSMKLPQWMQKAREKKLPKLTANPAQSKSQKQMKWFGYIMLAMIIIMGFTLPAGMGVYWLAGALFSIIQTVVLQLAMTGQFKRFGRWVKATWNKIFKKKEQSNI